MLKNFKQIDELLSVKSVAEKNILKDILYYFTFRFVCLYNHCLIILTELRSRLLHL